MRDSNPHALNVTTSTYAGQAAESEQVSARSMPANDGPDLQSVSNGHRKQDTVTTDTQTRRTWRALFIVAQIALAGFLALAILSDVSTTFGVFLAAMSTALSGIYIALRVS